MRLAELLTEPWAIREEAYGVLVAQAARGIDARTAKLMGAGRTERGPDGLFFIVPMDDDENDELDIRQDGTAVIPVRGYLTRRAYWRGDRSSYEWIGGQLDRALERADVRSIILEVDSGGGQVNGTEELAARIFEARSQKPVSAFVLGQAASAAYWIASSARRVIAGRTSMLGSIGVIWTFYDWSKYDEEIGLREIDIVSSQSPDKAIDPTTSHGRERIQATVDQLAGVFVDDVARNRGVAPEAVVSDFGRGWVMVGEEAVDAGLADRIGVFEDAITEGSEESPKEPATVPASGGDGGPMKTVNVTDISTAWLEENLPEVAAQLREQGEVAAAEANAQAVEAAREEGREAGHQAGTTEGRDGGATAERDRILGILRAGSGTGQLDLVLRMLVDPSVSAEQAQARLFQADQARRQGAVDAARGDEQEIDPPAPGGGDEADTVRQSVKAAGDYVQKHGGARR